MKVEVGLISQRVYDGGCQVPGASRQSSKQPSYFFSNMDLPEDLIVEIFSRLPQKDIVRSKCVCKSWYNLFSDQNFTTRYSRNSPFTTLLLTDTRDCSTLQLIEVAPNGEFLLRPPIKPQVPDYYPQKHRPLSVIGSCNGLVFIILRKYNYYHLYPNSSIRNIFDKIYFCNPVLGSECFAVTEDIEIKGRFTTEYELGFAPLTNSVKILRILYGDRSTVKQADILTVGSDNNNWRKLDYSAALLLSESVGVHVNGFRNWFGSDGNHEWIQVFDYGQEKIGWIQSPPGLLQVSWKKNMNLTVMNDHLYLIDLSNYSQMIIWSMKEYGVVDSWSKDYVLLRSWFPDVCGWRFGEIFPVMVLPNGDILFSVDFFGNIFCFSPGRKKCSSDHIKVVSCNATYDFITMYATKLAPRFDSI